MTYHESSLAMLNCSPRAVTLLKFLLEKAHNITKSSFWRVSKIITECGFSKSTYHRAIRELVKAGFVTVKERLERCGRQKSNEYIVHMPKLSNTAPTPKVSNHVRLKGMAYKIYLYLLAKCGQQGYCIRKKEIAQNCGISIITVRRYIRQLESAGYIVCRKVTKADNSPGYNFYAVNNQAANTSIARYAMIALLAVLFLDTLCPITDGTPLTISKSELVSSKERKTFRYKITYRLTGLISKTCLYFKNFFRITRRL